MSVAEGEAGLLDGLDQQLARLLVGAEVGGEAAFVAHRGGQPPVVEDRLEHVVGLGAPPQRLAERHRADRHDHELLQVHVVVGVHAAVEDVHHGDGQHVGVGPAHVAVQGQLELVGRGPGHRQRHAEDGVGPQAGLVVGVVEVAQDAVDVALVEGVEADQGVVDLVLDVADRVEHALAAVAVAAVAQLDRLELAGRGPGRDDGAALGPAVEEDLDLDGGVAPRVEDLTSDDVFDGAHDARCSSKRWWERFAAPHRGRVDPAPRRPPPPPHPVSASGTRAQRARTGGRTAQAGCWCSSTVLPAGSWRNACRLVPTGPGSLTVTPEARSSATVAARSSTSTAKC